MSGHEVQDAGCGACEGCSHPQRLIDTAIDRRTFLVRSAFAAAAVALAACAGAGSDATAPSSVSTTVKVSDYPALATVGGVALITASGSPLAIVRTGTNTFVALSRVCPHQGAIVNTTSNGFTCPRHGARFSSTGAWIGGQPTSSLHTYPTSYDDSTSSLSIG